MALIELITVIQGAQCVVLLVVKPLAVAMGASNAKMALGFPFKKPVIRVVVAAIFQVHQSMVSKNKLYKSCQYLLTGMIF